MKIKSFIVVLIAINALMLSSANLLWAEKLTPTSNKAVAKEDKEFNNAMRVWYSHRYEDGAKLLTEFAEKNPNSRWAAEAEMHVACLCVYEQKYDQATAIFNNLIEKYPNSQIAIKAKLRLGNIAELNADYAGAAKVYNGAMNGPMTWDQYKYLNSKSKICEMDRSSRLSQINCGSVALAACMEAMGKKDEAIKARAFIPDPDGDSLFKLQNEAESLGVSSKPVRMSMDELLLAKLPVLGHVNSNHFVAVIDIENGAAHLKDSIVGDQSISLVDLAAKWTGKAITFDTSSHLQPLDFSECLETRGGCCGIRLSDRGLVCNCGVCASQGGGVSASGSGTGSGGCGGRCGDPGGDFAVASAGRPTYDVWLLLQQIKVTDTPIWYNPGRGPAINFTINYNNDYAEAGIFGSGSKSIFDTKAYFLPSPSEQYTYLKYSITSNSPSNHESLYVDSTAGFPAQDGTIVVTDSNQSEVITYKSISAAGDAFVDITRGANPISVDSSVYSRVYYNINNLQIHTSDAKMLAYSWICDTENHIYGYQSQSGYAGEFMDVEMRKPTDETTDGRIVVTTFRDKSKIYYLSANEPIANQQGRIHIIENPVGPDVTKLVSGISTSSPIDGGSVELASTDNLTPKGAVMITNADGETEIITYTSISGRFINGIKRGADGTYMINALANDSVTRLLRVTMNYDTTSGVLESITDANGRDTIIETVDNQTGEDERIASITIPDDSQNPSQASFEYNAEGFLVETTDAAGVTSSIDPYGVVFGTPTHLAIAIDANSPANGEYLQLTSVDGLAYPSGWVKIGGVFGEVVKYAGMDQNNKLLLGITRIPHKNGDPLLSHSTSENVEYAIPSIGAIQTPSSKTMFVYHTMNFDDLGATPGTDLLATYERGPGENWPDIYNINDKPTWGYVTSLFDQDLYRYPTDLGINPKIWTGGVKKQYSFSSYAEGGRYNRLQSVIDGEGIKVSYAYDAYNNRTSTSGTGDNSTYEYSNHRVISRTDTKGNKWINTYDPVTNDLLEIKCYDSATSNLLKFVQKMDYSFGLVTKAEMTDPDNWTSTLPQSETSYRFDRQPAYTDTYIMHNTLTSAIGTDISLSDVSGFPTSGLVRVGTEIIAYSGKDNANNKLTGLTRAVLGSTSYNAVVGDRVSAFSRQIYHYDETYNGETETRGFLTSTEQLTVDDTGAINSIFNRYRYDGKGRRFAVIDPNGNETDYQYDALDRVTQITNPDSTTKQTKYSCCHKIWEQDENGHRVYYVYDPQGRLINEVQSGATVSLVNDAGTTIEVSDGSKLLPSGSIVIDDEIIDYSANSGNVLTVSQRGARGTTSVNHTAGNDVGRVSSAVTYVYDSVIQDRKVGLIDAENHETTYEYYANDRLKKIKYPDNTWEQYVYDGEGHMIQKLSSSGIRVDYTYENGKLLTEKSM